MADGNWAADALHRGGKQAPLPKDLLPQLVPQVEQPFDRDGWIFEIKWDGYRALALYQPGQMKILTSRKGKRLNALFPTIVQALDTLPCSAVLDGELTALDQAGKANFNLLQNNRVNKERIYYYVFDLLYLDGVDIQQVPLIQRKALLERLLEGRDERLLYTDYVERAGKAFFELIRAQGLEGMVAKDAVSIYQGGKRVFTWQKIKAELSQEFIVIGYTNPEDSSALFDRLLLAYYDAAGKLRYGGRVRNGLDERNRRDLRKRLDKLPRIDMPFDSEPDTNDEPVWVAPELVCEVKYLEVTPAGQLRHSAYLGLRDDKDAAEVIRGDGGSVSQGHAEEEPEKSKAPAKQAGYFGREAPRTDSNAYFEANGIRVAVSHPRTLYYPQAQLTKRDVVAYYQDVAEYMLPYLKDRPQVLHRYPDGIEGEDFYQKNHEPGSLPEWVETAEIAHPSGKRKNYLLCQNAATLLYLANLGCQEIHACHSRVPDVDYPDILVLDLDPLEIAFEKVIQVAIVLHDMLKGAGIPAYPKTSGKRGLHLLIPIEPKYDNDTVRGMAEMIAGMAQRELPSISSVERMPSKRRGKVYIDYLQNGFIKTLAAPYSLRPVSYAGVSTPLEWEEVKPGLDPRKFTFHTVRERLHSEGDPLRGLQNTKVDLEKLLL